MSSSSSEAVDSNNDASLGEEEQDVSVSITTQSMNVQFKGPLQSVLKSTVDFFIKQFPKVDLARKISLYYDAHALLKFCIPCKCVLRSTIVSPILRWLITSRSMENKAKLSIMQEVY
jgi:hypothetical protein